MPLTDAIILQSAVVPVVAVGVIKPLSDPCCQWVGVSAADNRPIEEATTLAEGQKKDLGRCWEVLGGRGGFGSGLTRKC